jgi:hypothetical protein
MIKNCSAWPKPIAPPYSEDNPGSVEIMLFVDRLKPAMRALLYEYDYTILHGMFADGWHDPEKLTPELIAWRERRQEAWLAEIPYLRSRILSAEI